MTKIAVALKAITTEISDEATIAPSGAVDGPLAAAKDKIKEEAGKIAGAIKEIITLVLPDAKPGKAKSAVVTTAKKAAASDAITLFANKGTADATHAKATEAAGKAAATIVAKATGEGMLKAIADDATTKAVRLAGGYAAKQASGATGTDDDDITAVVGETEKELEDDIFAGAVALRAITKTGKFGAKGAAAAPATEAIGGAASAAVNKLLGALMYAIKSGVEKDIKKIQESIAKIKSDGSSKKTDIVKEDTKKAEATTAKSYGASANNDKDIKAIVGSGENAKKLPKAKKGTAKSTVVTTAKQAAANDAITLFATGTTPNAVPTAAAGNKAAAIVAEATTTAKGNSR
ncbi:hypothetical protein DB313_05940 (plasmid) [Borrelia turcica IST7]|uniref:Variable large protein n=2 Tax=Borrelia turcica TaxID=229155 RepID=A0A386PPH6_9SPIR|nr:variable large family protein [Borrelia turcica]AYE37038.1 hypothetical protein DB313_05940 [Borrelia turcica IST7]